MGMHWKRERDPVDGVLRSSAPRPSDDLVAGLSERVLATAPKRVGRGSRTAFASALAVFMLGTFASFGGLSYAASGAQTASDVVKRVVAPAKVEKKQAKRSAAAAQYGEAQVPQPEPQATNDPTPEPVVQVAGATTPPVQSDTLPFTGLGLGGTAALGLALLALGAFLRRRELGEAPTE